MTLVEETVTQARLEDNDLYLIHGTAADDSQVALVEVRVDGHAWQPAELGAGTWQLAWAPLGAGNPDGGSVPVAVRAFDVAGRSDETSGNLLVDVIGPDPFVLTTALQSGALITESVPTGGLAGQLTWPAVPQAVALQVGWSNQPAASAATLDAVSPAGGSRNDTLAEASIRYAHAIATDSLGNQTIVTRGTFYFDSAATPDLVSDLTFVNWVDSGGKQIGRAPATPYGDQALFAGWNGFDLRLRWAGIAVDGGGDVAFYLGTGGAGRSDLLVGDGSLPFTADYAVLVSSSVSGTLYSAAGGSWSVVGPVAFVVDGTTLDVRLARGDLGLSARATGVQLLAVATLDGSGDVLTTIPDRNAAWNQFIAWPALGSGVVPAAGVWADAQLSAVVTAQPDAAVPIGAGDALTLTVVIDNHGSASLPALTVAGSTTGGLTLDSAAQSAANLAAGQSVTVTLTGRATVTGSVSLTLADSYHRPYALSTLTYTVDLSPPVSVTVELGYMGSNTNTIQTNAQDMSSIETFEVEIDGPTRRAPVNVVCNPAGAPGSFVCLWNAGTVSDGQTYQLRGRATDVHGNTSAWSDPLNVPADATPPLLALSAQTQALLADGRLGATELTLSGTLTDNGRPDGVQLCVDSPALPCTTVPVAADGTWSLVVPTEGDEYAATLTLIGSDAANNDSAPIVVNTYIDRLAPRFSNTLVTRQITGGPTPVSFASGTVTDGSAATVSLHLLKPDLSVVKLPATVNRAGWSASATFDLPGNYALLLVATDAAGNQRATSAGQITATSDPNAVELVSFAAALQPSGDVRVVWETATEIDAAGYNLYRVRPGAALQTPLNAQLIAAQGTNGLGHLYQYTDLRPADGTWAYWLEALDTNGQREFFGPATVEVSDPTAVGLTALDTTAAGRWPLAVALALLLLGLWWRRAARKALG